MSNGTYIDISLQGRLGADPEVRYDGKGMAIANLRVAVSNVRKDKNTNERIEETDWFRVVLFDKRAETAGQILKKGALVHFKGSLKNRDWTDKDGVKRVSTEVTANEFQIIASVRENGEPRPMPEGRPVARAAQAKPAQPAAAGDDLDTDIPF